MPIQILPATPRQPSWGEILGTGLGQGLNMLAQHKMQELQRNKNIQGLQALGYTPEQAYGLSGFAPELLDTVIKQRNISSPSNKIGEFEQKEAIKSRNQFISQKNRDLASTRKLGQLARSTLDDVNKYEQDLPSNPITRKLYTKNPEWLSAHARKIDANYKKIANAVAEANAAGVSSRLTNAMLRVAEESKASINQPVETQKALLKELIDLENQVKSEWNLINNIKNKSGGIYPLDIENRFNELLNEPNDQLSQNKYSGLVDASSVPIGTEAEGSDGSIFRNNGKTWVRVK